MTDSYRLDIITDQSAPPLQDSVSGMAWANNSAALFGVSTWDGCVKLFELSQNNCNQNVLFQRFEYKFAVPALKCTFLTDNTQILVGLADGSVKSVDLNTSTVNNVANHPSAISSMHIMQGQNVLITTGYDDNLIFWQLGNPTPLFTLQLQNKVFTSDFESPVLVAGMSNQRIGIVDINFMNAKSVIEPTEFLGKHSQLQSIAINNKCTTFGMGSIDGRANISTLNKTNESAQKNMYNMNKQQNQMYNPKPIIVFKSNKSEEGGNTIMYPVNSVGFSPVKQKWFLTAGSDGSMHFWDFEARNKIKTLSYGGVPITVAKVSPAGDKIAYALGNDWHIGQEGVKWAPKVGVHVITEQESRFGTVGLR